MPNNIFEPSPYFLAVVLFCVISQGSSGALVLLRVVLVLYITQGTSSVGKNTLQSLTVMLKVRLHGHEQFSLHLFPHYKRDSVKKLRSETYN